MLHHISIGVSDINLAGAFYDAVFEPLGYFRVFEDLRPDERHQAIGYGTELNKDTFTLKERHSIKLQPGPGFHLAFAAPSRDAVDLWHSKGVELGAVSEGAPKLWLEFGPDYYAAFLRDPDGWQIEAIFKS